MNFKSLIETSDIFQIVSKAAQNLSLETYVVGGYVRDLLLKKSEKKDIDFVCIGSGIALAEEVARLCGYDQKQVTTFKNFGTAMLRYGGHDLEFVGARKESYRRDSRKPLVENGTLEDDQLRRDFTINAMSISLNLSNLGELIDPFNGLQDLRNKIIRTPQDPDITFSDDPLRMMRAIRFAGQLQFDIDADTFEAIQRNAYRIEIVSQERITYELNKIILAELPSYGFKLMHHSGLLKIVFSEMTDLLGIDTIDGKAHKDNFYHTLKVLDNICVATDDLYLRWAAILHDIAKPATKRFDKKIGWTFHGHEDKGARMVPGIFRKLKLPLNDRMKFVQKLVRLHLRPIALVKETITDSAIRRLIVEAGDDIEALMILCRADITSKDHNRVKKYLTNFDKVEQRIAEVEEKDRLRNFQPVVDGEVIMQTFGIAPSKAVGDLKWEIREAILEGKIRNEWEQASELMLTLGKKMGLIQVAEPIPIHRSEDQTSTNK